MDVSELIKKISKYNFLILRRPKNDSLKNKYSLSDYQIKEIILGLRDANYVRGPENDFKGYIGEIWIFNTIYFHDVVYIKFRIDENIKKVIIISFHTWRNKNEICVLL